MSWIQDPGPQNDLVGPGPHQKWILNPGTQNIQVGPLFLYDFTINFLLYIFSPVIL